MKVTLLSIVVVLLFIFNLSASTQKDFSNIQVSKNLSSMPLSFTVNQGQWDDQVKFRANSGGATMWFTSTNATGRSEGKTVRLHYWKLNQQHCHQKLKL